MLGWLSGNIATVIVAVLLAAAVAAVIAVMVRDKRQGKSSCGCNCSTCALRGECHKGQGGK